MRDHGRRLAERAGQFPPLPAHIDNEFGAAFVAQKFDVEPQNLVGKRAGDLLDGRRFRGASFAMGN